MVQKFLDMVRNDPKAKELVKALPAPKSDAEAVEGYVKLAKDLGFDLTFDEIKAGLKGMEQAQKAQSEKVSLGDADLESVAGGANDGCDDTHTDGEWCWFTDSCSYLITFYDGTSNQAMPITEEKKEEQSETEFDCSVSQRNYDLTGCYLTSGDL